MPDVKVVEIKTTFDERTYTSYKEVFLSIMILFIRYFCSRKVNLDTIKLQYKYVNIILFFCIAIQEIIGSMDL